METEVRRLPKKTIFFMFILIGLGMLTFFLVADGQANKVTKVLNKLGYKNVADVKVYANHQFIREDINVKGFKYTISFLNLDTNEECKGFVLKDFKKNVDKDLICTKIK
jgi:cell division septal protein FtsQ